MKRIKKIAIAAAFGLAAFASLALISCNEKSGGKNGTLAGSENEPGWKLNKDKKIKWLN